ncbi:MAG TPA: PQQ-dependent sugar dehydrogenase [Parvibaculum sp.]
MNACDQYFPTIMQPVRCGVVLTVLCAVTVFIAPRAKADEFVGQHFELHLSDLPAPYHAPANLVSAKDVERDDDWVPRVPPGFHVGIFATGLDRPRELAIAPSGVVFVSQTHEGDVVALRDDDGDGIADTRTVFADEFREPTGLAVQDNALFVADRRAVWRIAFDGDAMKPGARTMVTRPGALGEGGGHITREIVFTRDGKHFFVSIGSETDTGEDPWPRSTIQKFRTDGHAQETFASGLRNPVGLALYPGTDNLYAVVNERDGLGAGLVPDYLTRIEEDAFYGFPYAYLGSHPDPQFGDIRPDLVKTTKAPDLLFKPHSVPLGLLFYRGKGFPAGFRGDAIVAMHGPQKAGGVGISLVRVHFHDGRPQGGYETFMTGFGADMPHTAGKDDTESAALQVWGRPVWIAEASDGALLVSDDVANVIWRVTWEGPSAANEAKLPAAPRH